VKYSVQQAVHPYHAVTLYTEYGSEEWFCNNFFFREFADIRWRHWQAVLKIWTVHSRCAHACFFLHLYSMDKILPYGL